MRVRLTVQISDEVCINKDTIASVVDKALRDKFLAWRDEIIVTQGAYWTLKDYQIECHEMNRPRFWPANPLDRNKGEAIALMHSELSEALEGVRKDLMDDKITTRKAEEVELVDCLVRIFDYADGFGLDLEGAYQDKLNYNRTRKDHQPGVIGQPGEKKF